MKKILLAISLTILTVSALAQSGTNSPYSQYGLGVLTDQGNGINRGMNGVGLGLREGNQINYLNPASYSSVDSLTFIFDVGMSLQVTNFKEGNVKKNANNADFEYAVGGFRLMPRMGLAFGILPTRTLATVTSQVGSSTATTRSHRRHTQMFTAVREDFIRYSSDWAGNLSETFPSVSTAVTCGVIRRDPWQQAIPTTMPTRFPRLILTT